jgi:hypothetical protein
MPYASKGTTVIWMNSLNLQFTVTNTSVISLLQSPLVIFLVMNFNTEIISISLWLQTTHEASFAQPNSFLPLFSVTFHCRLSQFSAATANSGTRLNSNCSCVRSSLYNLWSDRTENAVSSSIAEYWFTDAEMFLPHCCVAMRSSRTTEDTALYCCMN